MWPQRWVAYFDILGFKQLIRKAKLHPDFILEIYNEVLQEMEMRIVGVNVNRVHFSDTFIFYSSDATGKSYSWIQSAAKNFIRRCLFKHIPMRGAIACGGFYADPKKGIFFGKALTEAYREAESQAWIGLVITKTAENRVHKFKLNPARHQFPLVEVPRKKLASHIFFKKRCPAYDFHRDGNVELIIRVLTELQKTAPEKDKCKYRNTLDHIQRKTDL